MIQAAAIVLLLGWVAVTDIGPGDSSSTSPPIIPPAGTTPGR
jgi:hypothetical protein